MSWTSLFEESVTIWVVIDPIGTIPVFLAFTSGMEPKQRNKVAIQAVSTAAGILLFFIVFGQILMEAIGISLVSFRISGGIIMFLFALTMVFGQSKPQSEVQKSTAPDQNVAIFPLAVPSIAGPGTMLTVVVLTDNHRFSLPEQSLTTLMLLLVLAAVAADIILEGIELRFLQP